MPENHTPTPWQQAGLWNAEVFGTRSDADAIALCSINDRRPVEERRANAAFIVRAVNAHGALVAVAVNQLRVAHILGDEKLAENARAALKLARGDA